MEHPSVFNLKRDMFSFDLTPLQLDLNLTGPSHEQPVTERKSSPTKLHRKAATDMRIITPATLSQMKSMASNKVHHEAPTLLTDIEKPLMLTKGLPPFSETSPMCWDTLFRPKAAPSSAKQSSLLSADMENQAFQNIVTPTNARNARPGKARHETQLGLALTPLESAGLSLSLKDLSPTSPISSLMNAIGAPPPNDDVPLGQSTFGLPVQSLKANLGSNANEAPKMQRESPASEHSFSTGKVLHSFLKQYDERSDNASILFESVETKAISSRELGTRVWEEDAPLSEEVRLDDDSDKSFIHSPDTVVTSAAHTMLESAPLDDEFGFRTTLSRRHVATTLLHTAEDVNVDITGPIPPPLTPHDDHLPLKGTMAPSVTPRELPSDLLMDTNKQDKLINSNIKIVPSLEVAKTKLFKFFKKGQSNDHKEKVSEVSVHPQPRRKMSAPAWNTRSQEGIKTPRKLSLPTLPLSNKLEDLTKLKKSWKKALGFKRGKSVTKQQKSQDWATELIPDHQQKKKSRANRPPPIITGPIVPTYQPQRSEHQSKEAQVAEIVRKKSVKIPIRKFHLVSLNMLGLYRDKDVLSEGPKPTGLKASDQTVRRQSVVELAPHSACELQDAGHAGSKDVTIAPKLNRFSRMRLPPVSLLTSPLFGADIANDDEVSQTKQELQEAPHSACDLHDTGNELGMEDSTDFVPKLNRFSRMRLPPVFESSPHLGFEPLRSVPLVDSESEEDGSSEAETDLDTAPLFTQPIKSLSRNEIPESPISLLSRTLVGHDSLGSCLNFLPALDSITELDSKRTSMLSSERAASRSKMEKQGVLDEDEEVPLGEVFQSPPSSIRIYRDEDVPLSMLSPPSRKRTHKPFEKHLSIFEAHDDPILNLNLINFDKPMGVKPVDQFDSVRAVMGDTLGRPQAPKSSLDDEGNSPLPTRHLNLEAFDPFGCMYQGMPKFIERNDMAQIQSTCEKEWAELSVPEMINHLSEKKFEKKMRDLISQSLPQKKRSQIWCDLVASRSMIHCDDFAARYSQMKFELTQFDAQIVEDMNGIMSYHADFCDISGKKRSSLQRIVRVLMTLTPDLIYSTSLLSWVAFLVAVFPLEDEAKVCWMAKTVLESPFYGFKQRMFRGEQSKAMSHHLWVHEALVKLFAPRLADHLNQNKISHLDYLTKWMSSLFLDCFRPALTSTTTSQLGVNARCYTKTCSNASTSGSEACWAGPLDFETILSIWDMILLHGEIILVMAPISILKYYEVSLVTKAKPSLLAFFGIEKGDTSISLPSLSSERLSRHVSGGISRHYDSRRSHQIFLECMNELLDTKTNLRDFELEAWLESINPLSSKHLAKNQSHGQVLDPEGYQGQKRSSSLERMYFRTSPKKEFRDPSKSRTDSFASSLRSLSTIVSSETSTLMAEVLGGSSLNMDFAQFTKKQHEDLYFGLNAPVKLWNKLESFETGWDLVRFLLDARTEVKHETYHRFV